MFIDIPAFFSVIIADLQALTRFYLIYGHKVSVNHAIIDRK